MISHRNIMLLGVLVAVLGEIISFYTEYVLLVKPCFSCYILRYSYLSLIGLQLASVRVKKLTLVPALLAAFIIIISLYGVMGYMNYVLNPCIEVCPYGEDIEIGFRLFSLSTVGGVLELLLMLQALRLIHRGSCVC